MKITYSDQPISVSDPSIFLAGPTPRNRAVVSWRLEAIDLLTNLNYIGQVLIPERREWLYGAFAGALREHTFLNQVEWEYEGLENCSKIVFWVPRDLNTLPGFTTNIEFGNYVKSGRAYYGRPDGSPKNDYLDWLYKKITGREPKNTLVDLLKEVI